MAITLSAILTPQNSNRNHDQMTEKEIHRGIWFPKHSDIYFVLKSVLYHLEHMLQHLYCVHARRLFTATLGNLQQFLVWASPAKKSHHWMGKS